FSVALAFGPRYRSAPEGVTRAQVASLSQPLIPHARVPVLGRRLGARRLSGHPERVGVASGTSATAREEGHDDKPSAEAARQARRETAKAD
ncbi:MAG: hypothetical protein LC808_34125, partial [Actinobacteria bacterium]|nr:hypothetical protein [Actinomycetota bacterium]